MNGSCGSNAQLVLERFSELWEFETAPPDVFEFAAAHPGMTPAEKAALCALDQIRRWPAGLPLPAETYLERFPDVAAQKPLKVQLVVGEFVCRQQQGLEPALGDLLARFPDLCDELRVLLAARTAEGPGNGRKFAPTVTIGSTVIGHDQERGHPTAAAPVSPGSSLAERDAAATRPEKIGRYRLLRVLGDGGFGRVYLAFDDDLARHVAIKVPHRYRVCEPGDVEAFLTEARILARLEHASIVPVYDCGRTDDGLCFVVSKYIEGGDLATKVKQSPLTFAAAAEVVATIADALHCAHMNGIVHRDVKPANILMDVRDRPYLADFGIALKEEEFGKGKSTVGTLQYMSPEQVRGEGHLVDGRSDIFSLGVVLYELLTGRRLFSSTRFAQLALVEPRPPRQVDDSIPKELERVCLKALSPRVADRYSTALDFATDLRDFLHVNTGRSQLPAQVSGTSGYPIAGTSGQSRATAPLTIVPKGLRSFERDDAGFFLQLLPGPRDRDGLPESVKFWKTRIQETDPDKTFRVGLIYGPSGCGKSSFLKAGVIPLLGSQIVSLYVESTSLESEARLLKALRRECPDLLPSLDLTETLKAVRRGNVLGTGKKLLIVLDQFEQWLHSRLNVQNSDLLCALRQCDGTHLQCLLVVRDDFWMAVTHFLGELEVALVPGQNVAAIDLFSMRHAKKVLAAIGQAYGVLPTGAGEITSEQKSFIDKSVAELAANDHVAPVHLAIFAEMVKERPWVPATLKEVGGTKGVGVAFLEETFNGRTANPNHRLHQKAARATLRAFVSDQAGDIKGSMRHYGELLRASGYEQHPKDFDALLHILDSELRLITPTEPEGLDTHDLMQSRRPDRTERYYHLTHDYLVPSLREWLTSKQNETRRGRAELLLARRSADWTLNPATRSLPTFFEWLSILLFAPPNLRRNPRQHKAVLKAAARYFGTRLFIGTVAMSLLAGGVWERGRATEAAKYVHSLATARIEDVPALIEKVQPFRRWADPRLRQVFDASARDSPERLRAALALLPVDESLASELLARLIHSEPHEFAVICDALQGVRDRTSLMGRLWQLATDSQQAPGARFRAGVALAGFRESRQMPEFVDWERVAPLLASELVSNAEVDPASYDLWLRHVSPIKHELVPELARIFRDQKRSSFERNLSASVLGAFVDDGDPLLADLGVDATPDQMSRLLPKLQAKKPATVQRLREIVSASPTAGDEDERDRSQKKRAHAAALLLQLQEPEPAWKLLHSESDPRATTYLVARLADCRVDPALLLSRLQMEHDPSVRACLVLTLGSYSVGFLGEQKEKIEQQVLHLCQEDPNCAVHSAAEWALRSGKRAEQVAALRTEAAKAGRRDGFGWYVTPEGHTFVILQGPLEAKLGSPANEPGRDSDETLTTWHTDRTFALSTTEVTTAQYKRFRPNFRHSNEHAPTGDCPINAVSWFDAACYCRWLSEQEHIPEDQMCFPPIESIKAGMVFPDNVLGRTGYRLPTDAEWEYACRAGSSTIRFYGRDAALLGKYAWYYSNADDQSWPVGSLKPNAFGLFDMLGNVSEWCLDIYSRKLSAETDTSPNHRRVDRSVSVVERGGGYSTSVRTLRAANRKPSLPQASSFSLGFRIARTLGPNKRSQ